MDCLFLLELAELKNIQKGLWALSISRKFHFKFPALPVSANGAAVFV